MSDPYKKKWRDDCVIFLDDGFDADVAPQRLLEAGFCDVKRFVDHFRRPDGNKEERVDDSRVIALCNRRGWLLVTTDGNMRRTHESDIKNSPRLAIVATAHNSVDDIGEWVDGLIKAKARIERAFKKQERPWFAKYDRQGKFCSGPEAVK